MGSIPSPAPTLPPSSLGQAHVNGQVTPSPYGRRIWVMEKTENVALHRITLPVPLRSSPTDAYPPLVDPLLASPSSSGPFPCRSASRRRPLDRTCPPISRSSRRPDSWPSGPSFCRSWTTYWCIWCMWQNYWWVPCWSALCLCLPSACYAMRSGSHKTMPS